MWMPREPKFEELNAVDADVESVDARRDDLGVSDATWWVAAVFAALATGMAMLPWLDRHFGLVFAEAVFAGWLFALWTLAGERWGHRRYRLSRALGDAARPLAAGIGVALLAVLAARLGWDLPGLR